MKFKSWGPYTLSIFIKEILFLVEKNLNESCKKNLDREYKLFSLGLSTLSISVDRKKVKLIFFCLNKFTRTSGKTKLSLNIFLPLIGKGELSLLPIKFNIWFIFFYLYTVKSF